MDDLIGQRYRLPGDHQPMSAREKKARRKAEAEKSARMLRDDPLFVRLCSRVEVEDVG